MFPYASPSVPRRFLAAPALLAALALGCKVGPDYTAPRAAPGGGWSQPADPGAPALDRWWRTLGDPTLDRLEETALAGAADHGNLDLRQAGERIQEARALRDQAAGGRWPTLDADASVTREKQTMNGLMPINLIPGRTRTVSIYDAGFDASWEPDLFGRTGRRVESAQAQAEAVQAQAADLRLSVAAEVARTYLALRGAQRELAARTAVAAALRGILASTRARSQAGDLPMAEVDLAQNQVDQAEAQLPPLRAEIQQEVLGLGILLGQPPESEAELADSAPPDLALAPIPVGQRADLLRRRPDVRVAERQLAAATADIGATKAEWFPRLAIGAHAGFESLQSSTLFQPGSQLLSLTPLISWRILDGGRIRAEVHAAEARQREAALGYEKAVLGALTDAERALAGYRIGLDGLQAQQTALASAQAAYGHAQARYRAGDIRIGDLLASERAVHEVEDGLERARTGAAVDLVALYKALGGGWGNS